MFPEATSPSHLPYSSFPNTFSRYIPSSIVLQSSRPMFFYSILKIHKASLVIFFALHENDPKPPYFMGSLLFLKGSHGKEPITTPLIISL